MFESFQKFIPKAANHYGIATEMKAAHICFSFRELIPNIFKDKQEPEKNIDPAYYKNNTLMINVHSPAWAQEVIMRKEKIISQMNEKFGKEVIKDLRTQNLSKHSSP